MSESLERKLKLLDLDETRMVIAEAARHRNVRDLIVQLVDIATAKKKKAGTKPHATSSAAAAGPLKITGRPAQNPAATSGPEPTATAKTTVTASVTPISTVVAPNVNSGKHRRPALRLVTTHGNSNDVKDGNPRKRKATPETEPKCEATGTLKRTQGRAKGRLQAQTLGPASAPSSKKCSDCDKTVEN